MKLLAIVIILGLVALMAWVALKVNRLGQQVDALEEAWQEKKTEEGET